MIKKKFIITLFLIPVLFGMSFAEKARTRTIFIKPFSVNSGGTSFDFTDYMSEVIVDYKDYNLISDEEISNQQEAIERKMSAAKGDDEEAVREIMKMIDSDCIIYGSLVEDSSGSITISAVLLDRTSSSVRKTITITRERYLDSAAHAIANYLLTKDDSYIKKFQKFMKSKDKDIADNDMAIERSLSGIESDYEGRIACISKSPFIRLGYGGFAKTSPLGDDKINEYYPEGQIFTADLFIYRSRDAVGDGVDIYSRFLYKTYKASDEAYDMIAEDMAGTGIEYDNIAGKYYPLPEDGLEMSQKGVDLGFRFVGTTYFLNEAWSFYLIFGGRYIQVTEKYTGIDSLEYKKNFTGIGGVGGIGVEVTLNRYLGLFTEVNTGYVPVGDNDVNYDGVQVLIGITLRSNHIEGPILGFL